MSKKSGPDDAPEALKGVETALEVIRVESLYLGRKKFATLLVRFVAARSTRACPLNSTENASDPNLFTEEVVCSVRECVAKWMGHLKLDTGTPPTMLRMVKTIVTK